MACYTGGRISTPKNADEKGNFRATTALHIFLSPALASDLRHHYSIPSPSNKYSSSADFDIFRLQETWNSNTMLGTSLHLAWNNKVICNQQRTKYVKRYRKMSHWHWKPSGDERVIYSCASTPWSLGRSPERLALRPGLQKGAISFSAGASQNTLPYFRLAPVMNESCLFEGRA